MAPRTAKATSLRGMLGRGGDPSTQLTPPPGEHLYPMSPEGAHAMGKGQRSQESWLPPDLCFVPRSHLPPPRTPRSRNKCLREYNAFLICQYLQLLCAHCLSHSCQCFRNLPLRGPHSSQDTASLWALDAGLRLHPRGSPSFLPCGSFENGGSSSVSTHPVGTG